MLLVACKQHMLLRETLKRLMLINENQILRFACCSFWEKFSFDASFIPVGPSYIEEAISTSAQVDFSLAKIFLDFYAVVPNFKDLSIHVLFTTVGLILTKLGRILFTEG